MYPCLGYPACLFVPRHQCHALHMPWDNSVNKNAIIYAVATTFDVKNMPLTSWVRTPRSITLSRQTGIYLTAFIVWVAPQFFSTSTQEKPASRSASVSCFTVNGVS